MPSLSQRLLPVLQLTRAALVFTAIADSSASYLIRNAATNSSFDFRRLFAIALTSIGLYGFGMSLNDIIDRRRDEQLAAHRPLPSGRIGIRTAHLICAILLLISLLSGAFYAFTSPGDPRSFWILVGTLTLIAGYDVAGKYLVGPGLITLGLIRFFHACIPAPNVPLLWHPLLLLNHVAILSTIAYLWEEKRPPLTQLHGWTVAGGLAFINAALIIILAYRRNPTLNSASDFVQAFWITRGLLPPLFAVLIFIFLAVLIRRSSATPREAGQRLMLYGLLWLIVYDAAFVAGYVGLIPAVFILSLLPVAWFCVRLMRWWSNLLSLSQRPQFKRADIHT